MKGIIFLPKIKEMYKTIPTITKGICKELSAKTALYWKNFWIDIGIFSSSAIIFTYEEVQYDCDSWRMDMIDKLCWICYFIDWFFA